MLRTWPGAEPRASLRSACQARKHSLPSGARTGRALQNGCALSHRRSDCLAICCWPVAQAARHWQSVKPQAGMPPEKQMLRTWPGAGPCASLRSALPCAQAFTCQWGAHGARPAKRLRAQSPAKRLPCHLLLARGASGPPLAKRETPSGHATGKANAPHMARRSAVLQCAPRARTTGKPIPRTWPGASQKKGLATGTGRERAARIAKPFTV